MKILLFGSRGQLGWELQRALAPLGELTALSTDSPDWPADFRQPESLAETVRALRPNLIANAAAYTAVDRAESEPQVAHAVNAAAPGVLAREARALGATLLQFSTDYVFDGSGVEPRGEDAPAAPINIYGRSKLAGEEAVRTSGCRHLILRTSWVYAARGGNFARTILRLAAERDSLRVVDDQVGAPTGAELLADVSAHALRALQREPALAGTYHVAPGGETSWHAYACRVVDAAAARGRPLKLRTRDIQAIPTRDYPSAAARPLNSRLDTSRFRRAFDLTLPPWQQGVDRMLAELLDD
ncbi:dTDP-4-dehydrorhamnose reductase [uncultured Piscinibacter sp.]|uniref:dTDP-4-dehydrorhamnose reductase n=1 Tax=uncultured Piscinibacter sp. TaxID=1131835 RepID=UPI00261A532B|nr:dTDP-4-dehydrorhamnose reductase [uncultured Piscinibacter sp.]